MKNTMIRIMLCGFPFLLFGCGDTGSDCITNTGEIIQVSRQVEPFDSIQLLDNVNLFITQDSLEQYIIVEAGKNIIDGISTEVENRQLTIRNLNKCNWLRSYDKPLNVYLRTPHVWKINYNSSGNLTTQNTLVMDSLKLEVWGGCGRIELYLDLYQGAFYLQIGTADIHLNGQCGISYMYSGDFGLIDASQMKTAYSFISSQSSNDCYIWVTKELHATIESIGNIYYKGNPGVIETTINGQGRVIAY